MDSTRKSKVGTIEVVRHGATFLRSEYTTPRSVDFDQANKKDAHGIWRQVYHVYDKEGPAIDLQEWWCRVAKYMEYWWRARETLCGVPHGTQPPGGIEAVYKETGFFCEGRGSYISSRKEINYSGPSVCPLWEGGWLISQISY